MLFSGGEAEAGTYVARFGAQRGGAVMWSSVFTPDDAEYLMEQGTTIEAASAFDRNFEPVIVVDGERWMVRGGASVHPGFAQLMNLELVAGAFFTEQDVQGTSPRVAVISRELAEFLFGAVDVVGRVVNLRPADESVALRGFSASRTIGGSAGHAG